MLASHRQIAACTATLLAVALLPPPARAQGAPSIDSGGAPVWIDDSALYRTELP